MERCNGDEVHYLSGPGQHNCQAGQTSGPGPYYCKDGMALARQSPCHCHCVYQVCAVMYFDYDQ